MPEKNYMDPEDKNKPVPVVDDEAALDAEIEQQIKDVNAGKSLGATPPATPVVTPPAPAPEATPATPAGTPPEEKPGESPTVDNKGGEDEFRIPNKGKFESDEAYEKRVELFDLVKRRKAATTPEAKAKLSEDIKSAKKDLKTLNGTDKIINPLNKVVDPKPEDVPDPALVADKERLKQLGGVTKEDIEQMVQEQRLAQDVTTTLDKFVERHPEFKDEDVREVFFDFVQTHFNWAGKTGKDLMTVLELARESMYKPSETVEERVIKSADVAGKVGAMSFPGGGGPKGSDMSPEMRKSVEELKATGMSEEKAIELLSD